MAKVVKRTLCVLASLSIVGCAGSISPETIEGDCSMFRSKAHYAWCKRMESLRALPYIEGETDGT